MRLYNAVKGAILVLAFVMGLAACKKDTDLILSPDEFQIGSVIRLDSTINTNLNFADINNSSVAIMVSGNGEAIDKIVSYVSTNNSIDRTTWKKIKEFPVVDNKATLMVKATEIAAALGIAATDLAPGNQYTIYNEVITKSGKAYSLVNTNSDLASARAFRTALRFNATIVCPFTGNMEGDYEVIEDTWVDWLPGDIVQVTDGPGANQVNISQVWPNPDFGDVVDPLIVDVAPATGEATLKAGVNWANYGGFLAITDPGSSGFVFSCTGRITLRVIIKGQGGFTLILQKI